MQGCQKAPRSDTFVGFKILTYIFLNYKQFDNALTMLSFIKQNLVCWLGRETFVLNKSFFLLREITNKILSSEKV